MASAVEKDMPRVALGQQRQLETQLFPFDSSALLGDFALKQIKSASMIQPMSREKYILNLTQMFAKQTYILVLS